MLKFTVDPDDEGGFRVVARDTDNMPVDEWGGFPTRAQASRSAANRRYALKTRRIAVAR